MATKQVDTCISVGSPQPTGHYVVNDMPGSLITRLFTNTCTNNELAQETQSTINQSIATVKTTPHLRAAATSGNAFVTVVKFGVTNQNSYVTARYYLVPQGSSFQARRVPEGALASTQAFAAFRHNPWSAIWHFKCMCCNANWTKDAHSAHVAAMGKNRIG